MNVDSNLKAKNERLLQKLKSSNKLPKSINRHHHHHHHHNQQEEEVNDDNNDDIKSINDNDYHISTSKLKLHGIYSIDIYNNDIDPFTLSFQEDEEILKDGNKVNIIKIKSYVSHLNSDKNVLKVIEMGDILLKINDIDLLDTPLSYLLEILASIKSNQMKQSMILLKSKNVPIDYFFSQTYLKHEQEENMKRLQHEMSQLEKVHSFSKGDIASSFWSEQMAQRQQKKKQGKNKDKVNLKEEQDRLEQFWSNFAESHDEALYKEHRTMAKEKFWSDQMKERRGGVEGRTKVRNSKSNDKLESTSTSYQLDDIVKKIDALDGGFERNEKDFDALTEDPTIQQYQHPEFDEMMGSLDSDSVDDGSVHTYVDSVTGKDRSVITDENDLHRYLDQLLYHDHDMSMSMSVQARDAQWDRDRDTDPSVDSNQYTEQGQHTMRSDYDNDDNGEVGNDNNNSNSNSNSNDDKLETESVNDDEEVDTTTTTTNTTTTTPSSSAYVYDAEEEDGQPRREKEELSSVYSFHSSFDKVVSVTAAASDSGSGSSKKKKEKRVKFEEIAVPVPVPAPAPVPVPSLDSEHLSEKTVAEEREQVDDTRRSALKQQHDEIVVGAGAGAGAVSEDVIDISADSVLLSESVVAEERDDTTVERGREGGGVGDSEIGVTSEEREEGVTMSREDDLSRLSLSSVQMFVVSKKSITSSVSKKKERKGGDIGESLSEHDYFVPTVTWTSTKEARRSNKQKRKGFKEKLASDIFEAVRLGNKKAVEDLISADPGRAKATDWGGTSPLHISLMLKDADVAELLLRRGSPLQKDQQGKDPLQYSKDPKVAKKLKTLHDQVQGLEPVPVPTDREVRYLQMKEAAFDGDVERIKALLAEDPTCVDDVDDQLQTPLMFACMGQQVEAAMLLINSGADYKATSTTGKTAFVYLLDPEANRALYETAFWASPEGIAYAQYLKEQEEEAERQRIEAEKRRVWEEEQERIRLMLLRAEEQKKEREYFTKKSVRSIIKEGSLNYKALEVANRLAMDAHNEWIRQQGLQMMEEEGYSRKMWLILDTIEENKRIAEMKRRAKLAAEADAYAAEQARQRAAAAEEKRLRELAELRAKLTAEFKQTALKEWRKMQKELSRKAWEVFRSKKHIRVAQIKRMYADLKRF